MKVDVIEAPQHWASYLINGDSSGLNDHEIALADRYFEGFDVVNCADEGRFTWSYDLYGDPRYKGGTVLE
jgi:hypothetical protein